MMFVQVENETVHKAAFLNLIILAGWHIVQLQQRELVSLLK